MKTFLNFFPIFMLSSYLSLSLSVVQAQEEQNLQTSCITAKNQTDWCKQEHECYQRSLPVDEKCGSTFVCCPQEEEKVNSAITISNAEEIFENALIEPDCEDANEVLGKCIQVGKCESVMKILNDPVAKDSEENKYYLSRSQCDLKDANVKVCCPITEENIKREDPSIGGTNTKCTEWMSKMEKLMESQTCGHSPLAEDRIFGGTVTGIDEYPWTAMIFYKNYSKNNDGELEHLCGGSLISKNFVLTAAHCIVRTPKSYVMDRVRLGEFRVSTDFDCDPKNHKFCAYPPQEFGIARTIVHENYKRKSRHEHNDIALLRLRTNGTHQVQFNIFVQPICMPTNFDFCNDKFFIRKEFTAVGWGKTESGKASDEKLAVKIPYILTGACKKIFNSTMKTIVTNDQLCAGGLHGEDTCNGDSGGGLIFRDDSDFPVWNLIGVVSYGAKKCGTYGVPGVYTRVTNYLEWIYGHISKVEK